MVVWPMPELTEGGFRVKRLYVLLAGILCIYVFALAGCRSGYKLKEVTPSPDIIIAKDAEFTGVLKDIDDAASTVTLYNLSSFCDTTLQISGGTLVYNADGLPTTISSMDVGMLLTVAYSADEDMKALEVRPCADSWCYNDIVNWSYDDTEMVFKIADTKYKYDNTLVILDGRTVQDIMSLNSVDRLRAYGIGRNIYSLVVDKGHGYIRPVSFSDFVGGVMRVGYELNQPVTEDMIVVVPEGTYEVTMRNGDLTGTKQIDIERNKETVLDMSEFRQKPENKGQVIFKIAPYGAELYLNGRLVDYAEPVELNYGSHDVQVELTGYSTYVGILDVKSPNPTIVINLSEEEADNSEGDSSDNKNDNTDDDNMDNDNVTSPPAEDTKPTSAPASAATSAPAADSDKDESSVTETDKTNTPKKEIQYDKLHTISVKEPAGAEVYLNGEYKGIAPCTFPKQIGNETITLSSSGYVTKSYTVVIANDNQDVTWSFPALVKE